MKINIRYGTVEDASGIARLLNRYRQFYGETSAPEKCISFVKERLFLGESQFIVAVDCAEIIGFIQLYPSFSSVTLQRIWILNDLFVEESHRKQGVALLLLEKAEEFAKIANARQLSLETATDNARARHLYEQYGFQEEKGFAHYYLPLSHEPDGET